MASVIRLSRVARIAGVATGVCGSLYLLRDTIKPYVKTKSNLTDQHESSKIQPRLVENLPERVPYLLVGGGTASHSAMRSIRGHDPKAKVLIISSESHLPYMRPALSKELWYSENNLRKDLKFRWLNGKERSIFYEIDEFFLPLDKLVARETGGVSIINNVRLTRLDPDKKLAYLDNGQSITYEKCLLAPGGKPKSLPELESVSDEIKKRILYFRTADDFLELDTIAESAKRIAIIGGGFLGSELACALSRPHPDKKIPPDQKIYQIFPEPANLGKILPQYLSEWVSSKIKNEGVNTIPNVELKGISQSKDQSLIIHLSNGDSLEADYIVCAVGIEPDVELAKSSGLEVDEKTGGYLVNSELEARTDVWVAGDASCFYDIKLGRRRVEHHDHAVNSGKLAGQNMVGAGKPYMHQSMFWSDIGSDLSFEAVGIIDSNLPTIAVFADSTDLDQHIKNIRASKEAEIELKENNDEEKPDTEGNRKRLGERDKFGRGVVFYTKDGVIVGILLWNLFSRLTIARRILNDQKKYEDFSEVAKLFNIYLED